MTNTNCTFQSMPETASTNLILNKNKNKNKNKTTLYIHKTNSHNTTRSVCHLFGILMHHHNNNLELHIGKENTHLSSDTTSSSTIPCHHVHQRFSDNSPHKKIPIMTLPYPLFPTPFAAKFLTLTLLPRFRFLIFLPLPSLYFLFSNPTPLDFFSAIAFSLALFVSLNLALSFFARSFPTNLSSSSSPNPVVWTIGSKQKQVKNTNWGFWVKVYSNGDVYEGEFQKGKCWGSGVYRYHMMNGRYEGDWVDGKYDGYGVETWARGSRYRGQYREGLRHGMGIYKFYSGDVFSGEWSNGQCHGFGVHTCNDGSRYVGEFKWGVKHGIGQYYFRNGDIYAGEYFADKMHGFGVYQFQNGHRYEGAWHEGRRQGLGMYTFRNGETQCGHWQNGILDDPKRQNTPTGSPCAVEPAKVFNAVQDAHYAAEKAYNMARVDDSVNKVVASANKAAISARVAAVKAVQNRMHHNNSNDK